MLLWQKYFVAKPEQNKILYLLLLLLCCRIALQAKYTPITKAERKQLYEYLVLRAE